MNKLTYLILCFICLLSATTLKGQTDFRPGYIITIKNDTLHGLIDYRGSARNAKRCDFKANISSEVKEFSPSDIKAYRFTDSKFYVSKEMGKGYYLFLEFLVNGIADLYYYYDGNVSHYFIEKTDGQMFELTNDERSYSENGHNYVSESKSYLGFLRYAFSDCPQIFPMIANTTYDSKSLIKVTKKYHDYMCDGEKCIIYEKKTSAIRLTIYPFISMDYSSLSFKNLEKTLVGYGNVKFDPAIYPTIGMKIKTSLPRANEKLTLQFSGEYGKSYFYGSGPGPNNSIFEEVQTHLSFLKGKAGIKYTFPKGKVRPTFLAGGNIIYFMNKEVKRYEDRIDQSKVYIVQFNDDLIPTNMLSGISIEAGIDYHTSSRVNPFISFGFDRSSAVKKASPFPFKLIIQTIHIDAGIYF